MHVDMLEASQAQALLPRLAAILHDCVQSGASVGFMWPFGQEEAQAFFRRVHRSVEAGDTLLFGAFLDDELVGTIQLGLDGPCNQRHRGDVKKLLVHRAARKRGIAAALVSRLEAEAARRGLILLTLDTVTGSDAERLYQRLGWTKSGIIPNYAKFPDGRLCATTVFWKDVAA